MVTILVFFYVFIFNFKFKKENFFLFLFSIYIIIEAINVDLLTSRIIWIFFAYSQYISIKSSNYRDEAKKLYTS